jgi:uncharacterized membrane protein YcaP (DUF421 family)
LESILSVDPAGLTAIVLRTAVVYVGLLVLVRLAGKREIGQMTAFDLVVLLTLSNAVQNAMVGGDNSLTGGLVAAATLLGLNAVITRVADRFPMLRRGLTGSPTLLVSDGHLIESHLRAEGVTADEVMQALREHGSADLSTVRMAVLEVDGTISVVPVTAGVSRTRRRVRGRKPAA